MSQEKFATNWRAKSANNFVSNLFTGLLFESFAVINLRGVSTNKTIIYLIAMQTYKELSNLFVSQLFN
jgi:hypothetical protein